MLCASAAVLGPARADLGRLDPTAKPNTRIRTGFTLALCVSLHAVDEKELTGEFPVDERGNLQLRVGGEPIAPIPVVGCTAAEAQRLVLRAVERFFAAPPDVKVGIARMPRITVIVQGATFRNGAVRLPQGARLSDALAETSYLPNADLSTVQIARRDRDARVTLTVDFRGAGAEELSDPVLQDGDRIAIPALPIAPSAKNVAVLGEVARPGMVPWRSGMAVRDALGDAGGLLAYNYLSGEHITHMEEGRPLFVRTPESRFNLANFMRAHLFASLGALKIGLGILFDREQVKIEQILGHGGFFKTREVGQRFMAAAMNVPVTVMETAGEGGAWGIALLAAYLLWKAEGEPLEAYLADRVFAGESGVTLAPDAADVAGFDAFMRRYEKGLVIERAAVDALR